MGHVCAKAKTTDKSSFTELTAKDIDGNVRNMSDWKGKVVLVANVASMTNPEYKAMVELHNKYSARGFDIIAFPCNQFGSQESKCDVDIKEFAKKKGAQFTMMAKIDVNGEKEHEVYSFLKNQPGCGGQIMWNFRTKFLVSKSGVVTRHDGVNTKDLEPEVLKRLDA